MMNRFIYLLVSTSVFCYYICSANGVKDITKSMHLHGEGILAGYGDFNSDKATDVFTISRDRYLYVYFWDVAKQTFKTARNLLQLEVGTIILNIGLADFDGDGYMDVLVSTKTKTQSDGISVDFYKGNGKSAQKGKGAVTLKMDDQPTLVDVNGDLFPDLFGTDTESGLRSYWISELESGDHVFKRMTQAPGITSSLYIPTSNAFVDCTGDLHPDLLVMSQYDKQGYLFETWVQRTGMVNLTLDKTFNFNITEMPVHVGQMSFADVDSDSTTDLILPVCMDQSCSKSVIYMKSLSGDDKWVVLLDNDNANWQFPLNDMDKQKNSSFPFKLRFNDLTMDGNVDAVTVLQSKTDKTFFTAYLVNVKCSSDKQSGCQGSRTLRVNAIDSSAIVNPVLISLFDVNENGILDFMVTCEDRSNDKDESSKRYHTKILQNDLNFDTAFVKVAVLSGLKSSPMYGSNQIGAIVQISTTNTDGSKMLGQSVQLSQSTYFSLQLPYVIFGLGRSPNFIEQIHVGIPKGPQKVNRRKTWTAIIPNAQVIVVPYPMNKPSDWVTKLLVTPGKLLLQTGGVLIGIILLIGGLILILHIKEKREDEREKRRDAHKFHFDAL